MREDRMTERLAILPIRPEMLAPNYIAANTLIDGLQLLVPATMIFLSGHPTLAYAPWVLLCCATALLSANALGMLVAMLARSPGEVHLYAFMAVISVALLSGLFGLPMGALGYAEPIWPFWQLSNAVLVSWGISEPIVPIASPISGTVLFFTALLFTTRLFKSKS